MSEVKLTYFDLRARGELARWILVQSEVEFEDCRIPMEEWPALKPGFPGGVLPQLDYHGLKLFQSGAIVRLLAAEFDLEGKNNAERARADMVYEILVDIMTAFSQCNSETRDEEKMAKREALVAERIPALGKLLAKLLAENGGEHFAGDSLTYADLAVAHFLDVLIDVFPETGSCMEEHLINFKNGICQLPRIKEWIEKRPKTSY